MSDKRTIKITVEGGLIQDIQGVPDDVRVVVYDYDVEGQDEERLSKDDNGDECFIAEW